MPIPPSPDASEAILEAFVEGGIEWHPSHLVRELDPARKVARFDDDTEMSFDLLLGVSRHRVPKVVAESGMCVDGWIPVDPVTRGTGCCDRRRDHRHGARRHRGRVRGPGVCDLEFGALGVAVVDVTFVAGQAPFGFLDGPSIELGARESQFGTTRVKRSFSTDW